MVSRVHCLPSSFPAVVTDIDFNVAITVAPVEWKLTDCLSHRFLYDIRSEVLRYRLKSPSRFAVSIEVGQVLSQNVEQLVYPNLSLWVGFYNFGRNPVFVACRPAIRTRRNGSQMPTGGIETYSQKQGKWVPLKQFLEDKFPAIEHVPVGDLTMFEWWQNNGKVFNWPGLPNELKEHIIGHCYNPLPLIRINKRMGPVRAKEVTEKFGKWVALLRVSRQVRTLCLRICFTGSKDGSYGSGLCVEAKDPSRLKNTIRRLSSCPQMLLPGGLPIDKASYQAKELYNLFPRIYPDMEQYATLRHAVRKIALSMSFLDYMHFFRVTTGSFAEWFRASWVDYHIFDTMPHLKEIQITLPDAREHQEDGPYQLGPQLFYGKPFNCPRILQRLIYERVAEALAMYDNVKVKGFMEEMEEQRYNTMRQDARARLKLTTKDIEELYRGEGGGVQLEEMVSPGVENLLGEIVREPTQDPFWPPKCRCETSCHHFLFPSKV